MALCPKCDYVDKGGHLSRHHLTHHGGPLPRKTRNGAAIWCNICKDTRSKSQWSRHQKMHKRMQHPENGLDSDEELGARPRCEDLLEATLASGARVPLESSPTSPSVVAKDPEEVALVDAAIHEVQSFLEKGKEDASNQNLRSKYETMLPVLKDNLGGAWKLLDTFESLNTPSSSHVRVLDTSNSELDAFHQNGEVLPPEVGCILIRSDVAMPGLQAVSFKKNLTIFETEDDLEGQEYGDDSRPPTTSHPLLQHLSRHEIRAQRQELRAIGDNNDTPRNVLSLLGNLGAHVPQPLSIQILGYNLLDMLTLNIQAHYRRQMDANGHVAGKEHNNVVWLSDLASCSRFCLFGDRLSLSLSHLDILNGTWVTCLSGYKMWFIYDGPWGEEEQADFRQSGEHWMPVGFMKLVLLRPGDTFIMRPGHIIVHAVLTLDDSIMVGGMIWPERGLQALAKSLEYIMQNDSTTNEHVPKQLPEYIDAIIRIGDSQCEHGLDSLRLNITEHDVAAMQALKERLLPILACRCKNEVCDTVCPCAEGNQTRIAGCTAWCHPQYKGTQQPSARCKSAVFCKCTTGCTNTRCSCKKRGISCTDMCHTKSERNTCENLNITS